MPVTKRDYYEILGVARGASLEEIKRVYRQLAMKHHPDRVGAEHKKEAEERFKEISEAYAVLSDQEKRTVYDQHGHAGFDQRYSTEDIFRGADFSSIFGDLGGEGRAHGATVAAAGPVARVAVSAADSPGVSYMVDEPFTAVTGVTASVGDPAEFGAACAWLCSVQAGYITGQNWLLDGGAYPGTF